MVNYQLNKLIKNHGKICVDIIGPYVIKIKGKKENLSLKDITMVDPVTG